MSKRIDITGEHFGLLEVQEYIGGGKYRCRCKCGNVVNVQTSNLKNGHTKSCGCISRRQSAENGRKALEDLTGRRFGKLTALSYDSELRKWLCRCDCGNSCYVSANNLKRKVKGTSSCGCLVDLSKANSVNIVGGVNVGNIKTKKALPQSSTGVRGIHFSKAQGVYVAMIGFKGKQYYLCSSTDLQVCIEARKKAEAAIYGEFLEWYEEWRKEHDQL